MKLLLFKLILIVIVNSNIYICADKDHHKTIECDAVKLSENINFYSSINQSCEINCHEYHCIGIHSSTFICNNNDNRNLFNSKVYCSYEKRAEDIKNIDNFKLNIYHLHNFSNTKNTVVLIC